MKENIFDNIYDYFEKMKKDMSIGIENQNTETCESVLQKWNQSCQKVPENDTCKSLKESLKKLCVGNETINGTLESPDRP